VALLPAKRFRDEPVMPTAAQLAREQCEYGYHAPRKVSAGTGALRITRLDTYRAYGAHDRRSWYDRTSKRAEEQIPEILLGFYELALSVKQWREDDERKASQHAEEEYSWKAREANREANRKLIAQLEADAGVWHRARHLRRYIWAARKVLSGQSIPAGFRGEAIDYLDWAERYFDQLDPLQTEQRSNQFRRPPAIAGDIGLRSRQVQP
jgi:hypothetical protein